MSTAAQRAERSIRLGALAAAAAFLGLVLSLRGPRYPAPLPAPDPPRLRFLPVAEDSAAAVSRQIWSPVLFSFPSELGFGRDDPGLALVRPPLAVPAPAPMYLAGPDDIRGFSTYVPDPVRRDPLAGRFHAGLQPRTPVLPPSAPPRWQVEYSTPWTPADFRAMPRPEDAETQQAWEATAYLVFSPAGVPVRVFVETATLPEARPPVARALRAWRLSEDTEARSGRIRLRFEPDGREAEE